MYDLNDTIVAVSSVSSGARVIVRISGPEAIEVCQAVFNGFIERQANSIVAGKVRIADGLELDGQLYVFVGPHSYTGEDVIEIHLAASRVVCEALVNNIIARGGAAIRPAGPGEFTARAYLNGKLDLAQAEAVAEIISSSNCYQLAAAEKLLAGRLSQTTQRVREQIMDCMSLIEAGLDFSEEDIEFITKEQAAERLGQIVGCLDELLAGSIEYESVISLPAVGIAGAPNAGKSSLLNRLLGEQRSIVSSQRKTTRDVLTGVLELDHCRCVVFDCAGLIGEPEGILDELAQEAAVEALRHAQAVVLCVDIAKDDWAEDVEIRRLIEAKRIIAVATKCDLVNGDGLEKKLGEVFGSEFMRISSDTEQGVGQLLERIDREVVAAGSAGPAGAIRETVGDAVAMTARHRRAVVEAIDNVKTATAEFEAGNEEVVAMMLRAAYQGLGEIEQSGAGEVDDEVLERIFGRFCIGK